MKAKSITISGYKGFARPQTITLDPSLTILFGENGSGKSSLLAALATALSWLPARIRSTKTTGQTIGIQDIHNTRNSAHITITCTYQGEEISWTLGRTKPGYPSKSTSDFLALNSLAQSFQTKIQETHERCTLPLISYYSVLRNCNQTIPRAPAPLESTLLSITESKQLWDAKFRYFYEWFRQKDHEELQDRETKGQTYTDPTLQAVKKAIYHFLPGFSHMRFSAKHPQGIIIDKKGHGTLHFDQLSGGEQSMVAMVGDIARKLTLANPDSDDPLQGSGIMLIDEIDLHLHPSWQQSMIPRLKAAFPNCQFILTTHSPSIITQAKPGQIIYLTDEGGDISVNQSIDSYGKDVESIYQDYLGINSIRPNAIEDKIQTLYELLETDLDKAQEELNALQDVISGDTELVKLQLLIDRKRVLRG